MAVSNHAARAKRAVDLLTGKGFKVAGAVGVQTYEQEGGQADEDRRPRTQDFIEPTGTSMTRKTAKDFDPEVLRLFDRYVHGQVSRRGFLDGASKFAVGGLTAVALLEALSPRFAEAKQVEETDPRIKTSYVEYLSPQGNGKLRGYL